MAGEAVWGIDIGQCALKALRCRPHENPKMVVADAFDYIEYPKVLSQPGSDPAELVGEAMKQFLSRNSVVGDRVAISVSGQAGLARFIKLPPVEAKKIPDIVRYEARQQIPFDLNDVVWDYQRLGVGGVEEGFALETEVGLFAMKRDAVFRALEPFLNHDIEVDIVQLTPLVLYNFVLFDQLDELPPAEEYDPDNPPESLIVLSMGTDTTDLVITNGFRIWQRSIPLGGSHFTKALTRELKLTFAKAEHLKRNATAAADPKAVFQAMRPVFHDLLTELQRSIGYFSNLDRAAKLNRVLALGNAMKLPGLRRYLAQNLGLQIEKLENFRSLVGPQVLTAPTFQENLLSFGVSYGLAVQGLGKGGIQTNLLPREIIKDRLIKRKKPWAVAAAALLMLACSISYAAYSLAIGSVDPASWKQAESQAQQLAQNAGRLKTEAEQAKTNFQNTDEIGRHLLSNVEGRLRWLELLKAVNHCLPSDPPLRSDDKPVPISERNELHVTNLDCQYFEDVSQWYANAKKWEVVGSRSPQPQPQPQPNTQPAPASADTGGVPGQIPGATAPEGASLTPAPQAEGPKGPGWIVRLEGYHYHNADRINQGAQYVRNTLIHNLLHEKVDLPAAEGQGMESVSMAELGILCPVLVNPLRVYDVEIPDPTAAPETEPGGMSHMPEGGMLGGGKVPRPPSTAGGATTGGTIRLKRFDFTVEFCWQPKLPSERLRLRLEREKAKTATDTAQP